MTPSSSVLSPAAGRQAFQPLWTRDLGVRLRGLALAREKGRVLVWDEKDRVHLFDQAGIPQAQAQMPGHVAAACSADDGSCYAAVGQRGEVWWLAPDLTVRRQQELPQRAFAAALDPFGQYLAVTDARANLYVFDVRGRAVCDVQTPRPLHHVAFVPTAPYLLGAADYGLVASFNLEGECVWRDGLVAHTGALTVGGDGQEIMLACFTEGLQRYDLRGQDRGRLPTGEACRLASLSFTGRQILVAGLSRHLRLLDRKGCELCDHRLEAPAVALALDALGSGAAVALANGHVIGLTLRASPP
jgi:hypothetical protein